MVGASRLYRVSQGDVVDASSAQFFVSSSLAPVLLLRRRLKSVADVPKEVLINMGSLRLGWMLCRGIGELCVVRALVGQCVPWSPGWVGISRISMAFTSGSLMLLGCSMTSSSKLLLTVGMLGCTGGLLGLGRIQMLGRMSGSGLTLSPVSLSCRQGFRGTDLSDLGEPHLIDVEFRKAWMPFFCRSGHHFWTGSVGYCSGCGLDGWAWNEVKALPLPWFSGLAIFLNMVESTWVWPQKFT